MAIGMTYEQYWYGDPLMAQDFFEADRLRKKREDELAWWQGLYVQKALLSTVGNLFLEEGADPNMYPQSPLLEEMSKEREAERKAKEEERERLKLVAYLNQVMMTRRQREG